jgi:hypothetical protein
MKAIAFLLWVSPALLLVVGYTAGQPLLYAAAAALVAGISVGIKAGRLPFVKVTTLSDANARNKPLYVEIDRTAPLIAAVLAQEIYEANRKTLPWHMIASMVSHRDLELRGHEVEVQAAARFYGADETIYRKEEARAMTRYKDMRGMTPLDIEKGMLKHRSAAMEWVKDNAETLQNYIQE